MEDPSPGVGSLNSKIKLGALFVKFSAPLNQFHYSVRPFFDQCLYSNFLAESVPCLKGIVQMDPHLVFVAHNNRDAALRILCAAFGGFIFCNYQDVAVRRKLYSCPQSCDTASYDKKIHHLFTHTGSLQDDLY